MVLHLVLAIALLASPALRAMLLHALFALALSHLVEMDVVYSTLMHVLAKERERVENALGAESVDFQPVP